MMVEIQIEQSRILVFSFSVLIITHGREELLMKCLDSLRPPEGFEWQLILVANGRRPSDPIVEFARSLPNEFTLVETSRILPPGSARNLGMKGIKGEWVFFLDDDAYLLSKYWEKILPFLKDPKFDVIGGPDMKAPGMSAFSKSLAIALSSPFCTGATFARHQKLGKKMIFADEEKLTSCNLWVRVKCIEGISFPEDYLRAEETLFLQKLSIKHAGMFYHPQLLVAHHRRKKLKDLFRPTFFAGYYRSRSMREKLARDTTAFWLPGTFVLLHLLYFIDSYTFGTLVRLYLGLILAASLGLAFKNKDPLLTPIIAFLHYFIVFFYGVGFLAERVGVKWK